MPHLFKPLLTLLAIAFPLFAHAACHIPPKNDYLYQYLGGEPKPMLNFYYNSSCKPSQVDVSRIRLPTEATPSEQALYYFGLRNLREFAGLETSNVPNLVKLASVHQLKWAEAEAKLNQAIDLLDSDHIVEGEQQLLEVVRLAKDIGYKRLLGRAYRWLGNAKIQRADIKASLHYYKVAYAVLEAMDDHFQTTMTLNNIATVYMQSKEWPRAEHYISRALGLYDSQGYDNHLFEAILYSNASAIYFAMNDKVPSQQYMQKALQEANATGSNQIKLTILSNMSKQYSDAGYVEQALELAKRCINEAHIHTSISGLTLARCYSAYSEANAAAKNFEASIDYAKQVIKTLASSASDDILLQIDTLETLVRAYETQGNYQQALAYMKRQSIVQQRFYRQAFDDEILNEKYALERDLNSSELKLLEARNELQQTKLNAQRTRDILLVCLFVLIAFLFSRRLFKMKRLNRELEDQNTTDLLTGLSNRRYVENWLLNRSSSPLHNLLYGLGVVDIDHFKHFNDTHGHDIGDQVLQATATLLKNNIRGEDIVARWGGEEFVILISVDNGHAIEETLERLRTSVSQHQLTIGEKILAVTISIGCQLCNEDELTNRWDFVFKAADDALYQAKQNGRNQYVLFHRQDES
ncbi:diguanylate cyclase [Vibrio ostreicida]|uniref:tetratricopeptide repeat-containing diguanylate cyclase n=1 Tax=Vibrio ostreicida TaxID=526588 RepID=UPI003B58DB81